MHSEAIDQIATAMAKAQDVLKPAQFDKVNPHFKNKFASLSSGLDAAKVYAEQGISYTQLPTCDSLSGKFVLVMLVMHTSGQWLRSSYPLPEPGTVNSQVMGSALTYARRYQLFSVLGIVGDDDDDANAASPSGPVVKIIPEQVEEILRAAEFKGVDPAAICTAYGITKIEDLPAAQFAGVLKRLSAKGAEK